VQLLWKSVWRFLKKLKVEIAYDPAILLLGIYPRNLNQHMVQISELPCLNQH
jgi:hypothetical protein